MDETKDLQNNSLKENTPLDPLPEVDVPTLRTYKGDISSTVQKDKITTAKILISEQKRREKQGDFKSSNSLTRPTNKFALVFGVIFGLGAVGLIGYFGYTKVINYTPIKEVVTENFFVFAFDDKKYVDILRNKTDVYKDVKTILDEAVTQKGNTYTDIIFYKENPDTKQNEKITSAQFFTLYDIKLPSEIAKSISKDFVYGIYRSKDNVEPFLIIGLADYENAFDSMFSWENRLASDLEPFFPNIQKIFKPQVFEQDTNIATTTDQSQATSTDSATTTISTINGTSTNATSTNAVQIDSVQVPVINQTALSRKIEFTDVVFSNKDTRAARDINGNPFFYYAFIERDKILFAQDPQLVGEIVRKVKEKQLIR